MNKISLVVPCYNEEESIPLFYDEICRVSGIMNYAEWEFCFVDDGSKDGTIRLIKEYAKQDDRVKYISFSRNFGKESAIYSGLEMSTGDYVAVLDADLQHPPALLEEMYKAVTEEGFDSAATRRTDRKGEPVLRSCFSRMFYKIINKISNVAIEDGAQDYRMMCRSMVDSVLAMTEYNRFSKGIFGWVGFSTKWIPCENVERVKGTTKWSFWKLFKYSLEGITAFSTAPLVLSSILGMLMCVVALVLIVYVVIKTLIYGDPTAGWPSMMSIILLLGGIQLVVIGIMGQYLAKTYLESKHRPIYLIRETNTSLTNKKKA